MIELTDVNKDPTTTTEDDNMHESNRLLHTINEEEVTTRRGSRGFTWITLAIVALLLVSADLMFLNKKEEAKVIEVELEGKKESKSKSKSKSKSDKSESKAKPSEHLLCDDGKYSKRTLQLAYELPFSALFHNNTRRKYEASSVIVKDGFAYAICDASWAVSKFDIRLQPFSSKNVQIGEPDREEDSGYEAIFYADDFFYVVRESILHDNGSYHAVINKIAVGADDYETIESCSAEFEFEGDSKGFEGAEAIHDANGNLVILGLCEGNHCSESEKNDAGNGKLVAMRKEVEADGTCIWKTIRMIDIPSSAFFRDYSDISITKSGQVAISSQEESQLWVGQFLDQDGNGNYNVDTMEFDPEEGTTYDFPKNDQCATVYCNIEGIHWLNDDMLIAVSDKMKGRGKQDFRCFEKDQSVHVFVLPLSYTRGDRNSQCEHD